MRSRGSRSSTLSWGFRYCDLLLSQGKYQEVQSRASQSHWSGRTRLSTDLLSHRAGAPFPWTCLLAGSNPHPRFAHPLHREALRAKRGVRARRVSAGEGVTQAATHLQRAVDGLRHAGQQDQLPRGLLARAELHRFTGDFKRAQNDLDEAFAIATRGGMRLHETDCHLEYARLYVAAASLRGSAATEAISSPHDEIASQTTLAMMPTELKAKAREHFIKAKQMVEEIGYHRRDKEVQELEAMINEAKSHPHAVMPECCYRASM